MTESGTTLSRRARLDLVADGLPENSGWSHLERIVAAVGVLALGARFAVWHLVTVGDVVAIALLPVWVANLRHYRAARRFLGLCVLAVCAATVLTIYSSADHIFRRGAFVDTATLWVSFIARVGFIVWARSRLSMPAVVVIYGIGMLASAPDGSGLFASNPWKFGFSLPVTIVLLGLAAASRKRGLELAVTLVLASVLALTDARSAFAALLLTAILLAWQMRPIQQSMSASAIRAILGMGLIGIVVYNLGVALLLSGYLGVRTQQRSLYQLDLTGSLILGGRPELVGALALIGERIVGFGMGIIPSYGDIQTVKQAMSGIGYDPNNGYVERFMLGSGYALHSIFGDLWAQAGVAGLAVAGTILVLVLWRLGRDVSQKRATGIVVYLSVTALWSILFSPWYSSIKVVSILMALILYDWSASELDEQRGPESVGQ